MRKFENGQKVLIKLTDVEPGPFNEKLVIIQSEPTNLSGFVDAKFVIEKNSHQYLLGTVRNATKHVVNLSLPGSFFTAAAGVTSMPRAIAEMNVEVIRT